MPRFSMTRHKSKFISLKDYYQKNVTLKMKEKYGYSHDLAVPKITKVIINTGTGKIKEDRKLLETVKSDLAKITGQIPKLTRAKKAIAGFKIRKGDAVGFMITLRGKRMYDFCQKLIEIVLPRIRDFRGLKPQGFDRRGNFNFGILEQLAFPEIKAEETEKVFPLEITIVTSAKGDQVAQSLLEFLGFIFITPKSEKKEVING